MTARAGEITAPACADCHRQHESEKVALRLRITVLEAALERKTDALERLLEVWNRLHEDG